MDTVLNFQGVIAGRIGQAVRQIRAARPMPSTAVFFCALVGGCAGTAVSPLANNPSHPGSVSEQPVVTSERPIAAEGSDGLPTPPTAEVKVEGVTSADAPLPTLTTASARPETVKEVAAVKAQPLTRTVPQSQTRAKTEAAAKAVPTLPAETAAARVAVHPEKSAEAPTGARPPEQTLDVSALKTKLRETPAIGTFTKLALKNQMDDLVDKFRTLHANGQRGAVPSLRQPYDALVVKVVTLLQAGDPSLARTITNSREAIWAILADPQKFKSVG